MLPLVEKLKLWNLKCNWAYRILMSATMFWAVLKMESFDSAYPEFAFGLVLISLWCHFFKQHIIAISVLIFDWIIIYSHNS
jgi:hypothetical protein